MPKKSHTITGNKRFMTKRAIPILKKYGIKKVKAAERGGFFLELTFDIDDAKLQQLDKELKKANKKAYGGVLEQIRKIIKEEIQKLNEDLDPYKDFEQQDDKKEYDLNLGAFIDKYQKMMKFMKKYKEVPDKNKRAWAASIRRKVGQSKFNGFIGDWEQVVGYLKEFDKFRNQKDPYAWDIK